MSSRTNFSLPIMALTVIAGSVPLIAAPQDTGGVSSFEVASVKITPDGNGPRNSVSYRADGIDIRGCTLAFIIAEAYQYPAGRLQGPESRTKESLWAPLRQGYDIHANADHPVSRKEIQLMLRLLLSERVGLKIHSESKPAPIYRLVVAEGGPKFAESTTEAFSVSQTRDSLAFRHATMVQLSSALTGRLDRTVVDQTGLDGLYDFALTKIETASGPRDKATEGISPESPSAAAFEESLGRLGLKLIGTNGSIDYLVVDAVAAPTAN